MKESKTPRSFIRSLGTGLALMFCATAAKAANSQYFTTVTNGDTYSWDGANWNASPASANTGPYTFNWVPGNFARFYNGAGDTYTVTVNASESMAGLFDDVGANTLIIQDAGNGTGSLSVVTNSTLLLTQHGFSWYPQGFLTDAGTVSILCPITGPGCIQTSESGTIQLYGTNTFSGGYVSSSSSTFIDFNNNSSFGTGQILFDNTTAYSIINNTGPAGVNITNAVQTFSTTTVNFIGNSCTFGSSWYLGGSSSTIGLRNNGSAGTVVTLGPMSATTGAVTFSSANGTSFLLNGVNTYTGETIVGYPVSSGDAAVMLEIGSAGSLASTVISNSSFGGVLKLDGTNCLQTNAVLDLPASPSNNIINLNFTGTQSIAAIYINGAVQTGGTYGASGSSATFQVPWITGTGILSTPAKPSIDTQPQPEAALVGGSATFSVVASGAAPLSYQWYTNSTSVSGANSSSFTVSPVSTNNAGTYYVIVTNSAGSVTSSVVNLTVFPSNGYTQTITGDNPINYWLLSETNGTTAYDVIGGNNGVYKNANLGQPGYSLTDPATSIGLPGSGSLPPYGSTNGFVIVSNVAPYSTFIGYSGGSFSLEGWAKFTNFNASMRIFSDLSLTSPDGFAFGIGSQSSLKMTQGAVQDAVANIPALNTGVWYLFDLTCDGGNYYFYLDGNFVTNVPVSVTPGTGNALPLQFGCNPTNYFGANESLSEQVQGNLDQLAIYNYTLSATQVSNHFAARYSTLAPPVLGAPIASPATNYVSLSSTLEATAAGEFLAYQWYLSPSTPIAGATNSSLTLSDLSLSNAGSYYVNVTNLAGSSNSPTVALTVLPIPTNALNLNLTNNLVLHLPFDGNDNDTSGLGNNGTNVGSPTFVTGVVGSGALSYSSTAGGPYNYVTLGVVPALQFGATTNFSVSFWVQEPANSTYTNLPFFGDAVDSTSGSDGYAFAPYAVNGGGGGWQWLVADGTHVATSPSQYTTFNDLNVINDGNWHNLIFVANRSGNLTTYLDGNQVDSEAISFVGNISTTNATVIGQDPTGAYSVTAQAYIDDVGVWSRTLSQLEVSGIYLGGISNSVSFAPNAASGPVNVTLSVTNNAGQLQLVWPGGPASIQSSPTANGTYTNLATGATSPYNITPMGSSMFYRLHP